MEKKIIIGVVIVIIISAVGFLYLQFEEEINSEISDLLIGEKSNKEYPDNGDLSNQGGDGSDDDGVGDGGGAGGGGAGGGGGGAGGGDGGGDEGSDDDDDSGSNNTEENETYIPPDLYTQPCGYYFRQYDLCNGSCPNGDCVLEERSCYCKDKGLTTFSD